MKESCELHKQMLTETDVAEALDALVAFTKHESQEEMQMSLGEAYN